MNTAHCPRKRAFTRAAPVLVAGAALVAGCSVVGGTVGSGKQATEERQVAPFTQVEGSGTVTLEVAVGPTQSVTVTWDDNLLPQAITEVSGQKLRIYQKGNVRRSGLLLVKVTAPAITRVGISGASLAQVRGLLAPAVELSASGASQIDAAGTTAHLTVEASGASEVRAVELTATEVRVEARGASNARVNAGKSLHATASGASSVRYRGNPADVQRSASGASTVAPE